MKTRKRVHGVGLAAAAVVLAAGLALPASALDVTTGPGSQVPAWSEVIRPHTLDFRTGVIDTRLEVNLLRANQAFSAERFYVLQLDGPLDAARQAMLEAAGVALGQYLPHFAYVTKLEKSSPAALAGLGFVTWIGTMKADWKIDPELGTRPITDADRLADRAAGYSWVSVVLHEGASAIEPLGEIEAMGGVVRDLQVMDKDTYIEAVIPTASAARLAAIDSVMFIEEAVEITLRNDSNRWIAQSNVSVQTPVWNAGITGLGQVVGVIDGPPRESHCAFDDAVAMGPTHRKIIAMRGSAGSDSHGTHVAATVAGDNAPYDAYTTHDGLAYRAKLSCTNLNVITSANLETNLNAAHTDGARVHTNSWGDDGTTAYTTHCRQIDNHSFLKENSLVLFAVTNQSALRSPENAKNCLGVGATNDSPSQGSKCSGGTGPTNDGRMKPEAFLPGCNTVSANSGTTCGTTGMTGTSMASPAVAGAAALVRQYFTDGYYPTGAAVGANAFLPSSALVRGTLLNSCVDMTGIAGYPSNGEGWGRVLLDNALHFTGQTRKLLAYDVLNANGFTTGQSQTYTFDVNSSSVPLKVTLVWTEPPAAVNANPAYINNLDLRVTAPGSVLYLGNIFSGGQSTTGGSADFRNNVEMVLLNSPAVGSYSVTVNATFVNSANKQGYALVVTGDVSSCVAPSIGDHPDSQTIDVWDPVVFGVTATGTNLQYQWTFNGDTIDGAVSSTYTIPSVSLSDAGDYRVVVTGECGQQTSTIAVLTVNCVADFDGSGFVDIEDYSAFIVLFEDGDDLADVDGSGFVDLEDFNFFVEAFEAGC